MSMVITTWLLGCLTFVAAVFFIAEGYYVPATCDIVLCWLCYWTNRRALNKLESRNITP